MIYNGWFNRIGLECDVYLCKRRSPGRFSPQDVEPAACEKGFTILEVEGKSLVLCELHSKLYELDPKRWSQEAATGERKRLEYLRYSGKI